VTVHSWKCRNWIWLVAGTEDGVWAARQLLALSVPVRVQVVSPGACRAYGPLTANPAFQCQAMALTSRDVHRVLSGPAPPALVLDATHPFALRITRMLHAACGASAIPYLRLQRPQLKSGAATLVDRLELVQDLGPSSLLTAIGSRNLAPLVAWHGPPRTAARILPTATALQQALVEAAGEMPILGPNCYGLLNLLDGVALWPDQHGGRRLEPGERGVAIVSQSSNIAISMTMQRRGLPVAYVATAGNQAQLGLSRIARALLDDDRVSALGLHVEGFDSVRGFETLAREARARRVPVVVMKTGRSERGRAANLSHTASIAGSDAGADAFLRRLGFARAPGIPEFLETLKLFHVHGAFGGSRLGVMCCSGGEASVLSDAVAETGLTLPEPTPDHVAAVKKTVHPLVPVTNPLDYHTFSWGDGPALARIFTAFAREAFDAVLLVLDFPRPDRCDDAEWEITAGAFDRAMRTSGAKGVIAATLGENLPEARAAQLTKRGIAPLAGVREALAAIECAAMVGAAWRTPPRAPVVVHPAPGDPGGAPVLLDEAGAKRWLAEFGVPVPPGSVAKEVEQAVEIAASLGGPVAVKALGIAHKTERQAVRLGLRQPAEIRDAARALLALGRGVLIERFEAEVVAELIVGLHRDPQLGLLLAVGSGGTLVELVADSVTLLLPVTESEIRDALSRLRTALMLRGWRGRAPADVDAAVAAILAVADFAVANSDRIEELDINPLGVRAKGSGAFALDALIRTGEIPDRAGCGPHSPASEANRGTSRS